ncbi:MarR family winged helix-turn-helix transcriptional regulator [Nocardia stercoris]|uniref:MarR family transcriptional regulator n=1 Tax=Nocardia stercoris TaxID=2483361 RepID=A0A3M2LE21_9NOCA|nr:MarR family transcriptional regulator [Nocardia stercoris]RMI34225.1 MarR family transcriptional regulator [Nocardia stercoris]
MSKLSTTSVDRPGAHKAPRPGHPDLPAPTAADAAVPDIASHTADDTPGRAADSTPHATADPLVAEWRKLLCVHASVSCALENELQKRHGIGLSEFETLDRLLDTGSEKYRMSELAEDIHLSQSALSRTVARLEKDGLVERDLCDFDRRAIFICVTDQGRATHAAAAPTHREVLERTLH